MLIKKTKKIKKISKNRILDTERRIQKKKTAFTGVNQRLIFFQTRLYTDSRCFIHQFSCLFLKKCYYLIIRTA
jgi:hypothetical protein